MNSTSKRSRLSIASDFMASDDVLFFQTLCGNSFLIIIFFVNWQDFINLGLSKFDPSFKTQVVSHYNGLLYRSQGNHLGHVGAKGIHQDEGIIPDKFSA